VCVCVCLGLGSVALAFLALGILLQLALACPAIVIFGSLLDSVDVAMPFLGLRARRFAAAWRLLVAHSRKGPHGFLVACREWPRQSQIATREMCPRML